MKKISLYFLASILIPASAYAGSSEPERVVELFTSQGCSSCPPANRIITSLAKDSETLALSYGVTYWDYLGWKDTFADPKFTQRQKSYGQTFEMSNLYTPQIVLNGASHGSRYSERDVRTMNLPSERARIKLMTKGEGLEARGESPSESFLTVLVEYVPGPQTVPVKAGENRGRTLTLSNVVTDVENLGVWTPDSGETLPVIDTVQAGKAYALLLHDLETGKVEAAATYQAD